LRVVDLEVVTFMFEVSGQHVNTAQLDIRSDRKSLREVEGGLAEETIVYSEKLWLERNSMERLTKKLEWEDSSREC